MGGFRLEFFKFGMYVMFPIGIMYYFGTNLDNRFSVPGFWPKAEESHRIPHDRDELIAEYHRMKAREKFFKSGGRRQRSCAKGREITK